MILSRISAALLLEIRSFKMLSEPATVTTPSTPERFIISVSVSTEVNPLNGE